MTLCDDAPWLGWDTIWSTAAAAGDWSLAGVTTGNVGGLRAQSPLETAVVLALFTDRRAPTDHPLSKWVDPEDPRGWWGDGIDVRADLGEAPLGSHLWMLERAAMLTGIERWAETMIREALAPLITRRVAVRLDVEVARRADGHGLDFAIRLFGRDGTLVYDRRFEFAWNSVSR